MAGSNIKNGGAMVGSNIKNGGAMAGSNIKNGGANLQWLVLILRMVVPIYHIIGLLILHTL